VLWFSLLNAALFGFGSSFVAGQQVTRTELAGGSGGREFTDVAPSPTARILEIQIRSGDQIDSLQVIFILPDGRTAPGPVRGGRGGNPQVFRLDSDETIQGISGRCGDLVDSIRFHTNKRTSPTFGGRGGNREYRIEVPGGGQFAGFTGRYGSSIDAIGLAVFSSYGATRRGLGLPDRRNIPEPPPSPVMETTIAGGRGGNPFSDREVPSGARLAEIRISSGDMIDSIQAIYVLPDGRSMEGVRHGGGGGRVNSLRLDSDEYVIGISGRYGDKVDSIRIHTNKRVSQNYGGGGGNRDFRIEVPARNQAVGFTGRSGDLLDAIGLTYQGGVTGGSPWRRPRP
jgi:hypothetical protein